MTLPPFLRERDPDWRTDREAARDAYALTHEQPLLLGGDELLDVETALQWAERLAAEVLR